MWKQLMYGIVFYEIRQAWKTYASLARSSVPDMSIPGRFTVERTCFFLSSSSITQFVKGKRYVICLIPPSPLFVKVESQQVEKMMSKYRWKKIGATSLMDRRKRKLFDYFSIHFHAFSLYGHNDRGGVPAVLHPYGLWHRRTVHLSIYFFEKKKKVFIDTFFTFLCAVSFSIIRTAQRFASIYSGFRLMENCIQSTRQLASAAKFICSALYRRRLPPSDFFLPRI